MVDISGLRVWADNMKVMSEHEGMAGQASMFAGVVKALDEHERMYWALVSITDEGGVEPISYRIADEVLAVIRK